LKVFDMTGNMLQMLVNKKLQAGSYGYEGDGNGLPGGIYFYRLKSCMYSKSGKMLLLK